MNKTTLVIDGNWLLMSRLGVMMDNFNTNDTESNLKYSSEKLVEFLAQSVVKEINLFGDYIDNIIMVQDGGSWRKHLEKPKLYNEEYKGNRENDSELSWGHIWTALSTFCENFNKNNITCVTERNIEGDDWIWFWSRYLNSIGTNVVIWSSDADLKQLVQKYNDNWTIWFNDKKGLVVHNDYKEPDNNIDAFMEFEYFHNELNRLIEYFKQKGYNTEYINPFDIVGDKVICGDSGDNIKSIVRIYNGKQTLRVSEKEWNSIRESLNINSLDYIIDHKSEIINNIHNLKRFKKFEFASIEDYSDMIDFNIKLVCLDKKYIPENIRNIMKSHINDYKIADLSYIRNNYKILSTPKNDIIGNLFEDLEMNS